MNRKIVVVIIMLVLICTVFTSVVVSVEKKPKSVKKSEDFISFAIKHPSSYMTRLVVLYFMLLLFSTGGERMDILREVYRI